jgi:hypothetical protein
LAGFLVAALQIVGRNIIKFVPWQFAHMVVMHGFAADWQIGVSDNILLWLSDILPIIWLLFVLVPKQHRGLHDMASPPAEAATPPSVVVFADYIPAKGSVITSAWFWDQMLGLYMTEPDGRKLQVSFYAWDVDFRAWIP